MALARSAIGRLLRRPVRVLHRSEPWIDAYGVEHPGAWESTPVLAYVEQTTTQDVTAGGEVVQADWLLLAPGGITLSAWDRIEVPDMATTFEVIGLPSRLRRPRTDAEHHIEARLRTINTGEVMTDGGSGDLPSEPDVPG